MTDWGTVAFSALSSIGFGGSSTAVVKYLLDRGESQRVWERDRVTERYSEARQALSDLQSSFVNDVSPLIQQSPMPSLEPGFKALDARFKKVRDTVGDALVVARSSTTPLLLQCMKIDYGVLAPYSRPQGFPAIAGARIDVERRFIGTLAGVLLLAMRLDLGLVEKKKIADTKERIDWFLRTSEYPRSVFAGVSNSQVYSNLTHFQVVPLFMADDLFRMSPESLDILCEEIFRGAVVDQGVEALLIKAETGFVNACVRGDLGYPDRQLFRLRQIGMTVEGAFRRNPGAGGWRDLPNGSRAFVWTRDSPYTLV